MYANIQIFFIRQILKVNRNYDHKRVKQYGQCSKASSRCLYISKIIIPGKFNQL